MISLHVTCTITCAVLSESVVGSTANFLREIPHSLSCFCRATRMPTPDCTKFRPTSHVEKPQKEFYFCEAQRITWPTRVRSLEMLEMQSSSNLEQAFTKTQLPRDKYCITRYFRGRKFSRKVNLRYFREKIFSRIYCSRENIFPRKFLLARISSREFS